MKSKFSGLMLTSILLLSLNVIAENVLVQKSTPPPLSDIRRDHEVSVEKFFVEAGKKIKAFVGKGAP